MSCNFAASVNKICLVKSNLSNEGRGSCKVEGGGGGGLYQGVLGRPADVCI